jgi:hypothetical protein
MKIALLHVALDRLRRLLQGLARPGVDTQIRDDALIILQPDRVDQDELGGALGV